MNHLLGNQSKMNTVKNSMGNLPTAKDYISKNLTDFWEGGKAQYTEEDVEKAMIEFAKLHVEASLNQAKEMEKTEKEKFDNILSMLQEAYRRLENTDMVSLRKEIKETINETFKLD